MRRSTLDPLLPFVYSYWTVHASHDPRPTVGWSVGNMGTAIAERLLDAGYPLVVNNRTPEKAEALAARGADVAATPEELAEHVDVVITYLRTTLRSRAWQRGLSAVLGLEPCSST